jgi:murein DD-endopeptidase MepM/ murein hydrolase activator NlpD
LFRCLYLLILAIGLSLLGGILLLSQSIQAATPYDPAQGTYKPAEFPARLPWAAGVPHFIGWTYGVCNPSDYSQGDHCNFISSNGPHDYYALDFDLHSTGDDVYPIAGGTVLYAGPASGGWAKYGNIVYLQHNINGTLYESLYAHLDTFSVATTGDFTGSQQVDVNTPLGKAGKTGCSSCGIHLHFALYKGSHFKYPGDRCECGVGPYDGMAVVPEALLGEGVYENFQWWRGPLTAGG